MPGNNAANAAASKNGFLNRAGRAVGVPGWALAALAVATLCVVAYVAYASWRAWRGDAAAAAAAATVAVVTSAADECTFRGRFLGDDNKCHLPCQATVDGDGKVRERRCWIQPLGPSSPGVCVSKAYAEREGFECRDSPPLPAPKAGFARSVSSAPLVPVPEGPDESACDGRSWAVIPGEKGGCCDTGFLWNKQVKMCCENANTSRNARCKKSDKEYVGAPGALGVGWTWLGVKGSGPTAVHSWRSWDGIEMQRTAAAGKDTYTKAVHCYDYATGKKVKTVGRECDKGLRSSGLDCGASAFLTFGKDKKAACAPCPATPAANWGWGYGVDARGKPQCAAPPPAAAAAAAPKAPTPAPKAPTPAEAFAAYAAGLA